jgi:hypothetical protein
LRSDPLSAFKFQSELFDYIPQLAHLVRLGVLASWLNIDWACYFWMDVNVVTSANPAKPEAQFIQQTLQIAEGNNAFAAPDGFQGPFRTCHFILSAKSERTIIIAVP